jgi:hypothetical protein
MSRKRGMRGGGVAELYAARQAETITLTDDENKLPPISIIDDETGEKIDDEEPAADEPEDDGDEEPAADEPEDDDSSALTTMQRQLAAMQAERDAALKKVDDATNDVVVSQSQILQQALGSAKQRAEEAEAEIAAASAAGDHVGVAKATAKLTKAVQDQDRFELAVDEISAEIEERKKPKSAPAPAANTDPYVASLKAFSDPAKEWLIKHRDKIEGNVQVGKKAQALALMAEADGIAVDSPEFFAYLDKGLGFADVTKAKRNKPAAARPQSAAPTGNRAGSGRANEVVLTAAEKQTALAMGMSLAEYGRNKLEIIKNAKDPNRPGLRYSADTAHSSRR